MGAVEDYQTGQHTRTIDGVKLVEASLVDEIIEEDERDMKAIIGFAERRIWPEHWHEFLDDLEKHFGRFRTEKLIS